MRYCYIGPVIFAKYTPQTTSVQYRGCGNKKCKYCKCTQKGNFCSECGDKISDLQATETVQYPDCEVRGRLLMSLDLSEASICLQEFGNVPNGYHLILPNQNRNNPRDFESEGETFVDLSTIDIHSEIYWLNRAFVKEIEAFRTLYQSVEVRWISMTYDA